MACSYCWQLSAGLLLQVLYAFVQNMAMGISIVMLGGLGNTATPAIAAILSAHTPASQQVLNLGWNYSVTEVQCWTLLTSLKNQTACSAVLAMR